jgi:hypothetical protein
VFQVKKRAIQTLVMHETLLCHEAVSRTYPLRFREGCEDLDYPRSGWMSTASNLEAAAELHELVARNHQVTLKLVGEQQCINQEMIFFLFSFCTVSWVRKRSTK